MASRMLTAELVGITRVSLKLALVERARYSGSVSSLAIDLRRDGLKVGNRVPGAKTVARRRPFTACLRRCASTAPTVVVRFFQSARHA